MSTNGGPLRLTLSPRELSQLNELVAREDDTGERERHITLSGGIYDQPLILSAGRWRVMGPELDAAETLHWRGPAIIALRGASARLEGLAIHAKLNEAQGEIGAALRCEGELSLERCAISASGGHALSLSLGSSLRLSHTRLHHSGRCGLYFDADELEAELAERETSLSCSDCRFEWNGADQALRDSEGSSDDEHETDGVWLGETCVARFERCYFEQNRGDGIYAKAGQVTAIDCHFAHNGVNGAYAGERARLLVERCVWRDSGEAGLGVKGGFLTALSCELRGGEGLGIFALDGAQIEVRGGVVHDHRGGGLLVTAAREAGVSLRDFSCVNNGQIGVTLSSLKAARLLDLQISGSTQAQLFVTDAELSTEGLRLIGGQFGFAAETSHSEHLRLQVSEARDVGLLLKATDELDEELQERAPKEEELKAGVHRFHKLNLTQQGGVGLLLSCGVSAEVSESELRGSPQEPARELVSLDEAKLLTLSDTQLMWAQVGVYAQRSRLSLTRCRVLNCRVTGVSLSERSALEAVDCELREQPLSEEEVHRQSHELLSSTPLSRAGAGLWCHHSDIELRRCELYDHRGSQLILIGESAGCCFDTTLSGGGDAGVLIAQRARLSLLSCVISGQKSAGVWLEHYARLEAQGVELFGQESGGLFARDHSLVTLISCRLHHQKKACVMCDEGSGVHLDQCELSDGEDAGVLIESSAEAVLRRCRLHGFALAGIAVHPEAHLELEASELEGGDVGVLCLERSQGSIIANWIHSQGRAALLVHRGSGVEVTENVHISRDEAFNEEH